MTLGIFLVFSLMFYICDEQRFNMSMSLLFFFFQCRGKNGSGKIVKTDTKVTAKKVEKVITLHFYVTLLVMHLGGRGILDVCMCQLACMYSSSS